MNAATGEEEVHHLALADVRNLQRAVGRRNLVQVGVVGPAVASSVVVVDVGPVLGAGVALPRDGTETLGRGPVEKPEGGWLDLGDRWGLARLTLDCSFRQL